MCTHVAYLVNKIKDAVFYSYQTFIQMNEGIKGEIRILPFFISSFQTELSLHAPIFPNLIKNPPSNQYSATDCHFHF